MTMRDRRTSLLLGLAAVATALAPAAQDPAVPPPPPPNAESPAQIRLKAALRAYDMAWLYYSENRVTSEKVYLWSRWLLEAQRDASSDKASVVAACQDHLERIKKLEYKIRRIRKIGFGDSLDVVEVDCYRKEAELWLARANAP
jgi:hypothetical protein